VNLAAKARQEARESLILVWVNWNEQGLLTTNLSKYISAIKTISGVREWTLINREMKDCKEATERRDSPSKSFTIKEWLSDRICYGFFLHIHHLLFFEDLKKHD
jgi:hypothetical protein